MRYIIAYLNLVPVLILYLIKASVLYKFKKNYTMTSVVPSQLTFQNILHKHLFMFHVYIVNLQTTYR